MNKYYVSGCKDNGSEIETCDDSEAKFWTLYERKDNGLSHALLDCDDRLSAEAAMAVYVERDTLQEQVLKLEEQLAELAAQEPFGFLVVTGSGADKFSRRKPRLRVTNERPIPLYTRAAPPAPLTVKLPQRQECEGYHIDEAYLIPADDGDCYYRDDVIESLKNACAAAGIKLQIEGE